MITKEKLTLEHVAKVCNYDLGDINENGQAGVVRNFALRVLDADVFDTLHAIHERGPLYDGDVPSKSQRNELLALNLIHKCVVKGEQGYQVCNYLGHEVWKVLSETE